jgi:AcrR family transcriptional regulator
MGQKAESLRQRIVAAADQLFYRQGYEHTSFSDIAESVGVSRGNFYYHFKTKDEILDAVIGNRLAHITKLTKEWETQYRDPKQRIQCYIDILIDNRVNIKHHGCPIGTLCSELSKLGHPNRRDANKLLAIFQDWLTAQFTQLGYEKDAAQLAMHLLSRAQGIATVANALEDETFLRREVRRLNQWLDDIEK